MDNAETVARVIKVGAGEAAASGFAKVMPVHILIALSRMSEDEASSNKIAVILLRQEFDFLGIDPRRFRRRLRGVLALRGKNKPASSMRPSESTKCALAMAETLAGGSKDAPFLVHLLHAVFLGLADIQTSERDNAAEEIPYEL